MEKELLTGEFEKGQKGLICRRPSDRGAYIVLDRRSQSVEAGIECVLEITGQASGGKLRFARSLGSVQEYHLQKHGAAIHAALNDPNRVGPGSYTDADLVSVEVDGLGRLFYKVVNEGTGLEPERYWRRNKGKEDWLPPLPMTEPAKRAHEVAQTQHQEWLRECDEARRVSAEQAHEENERRVQATKDQSPMARDQVVAIARVQGSENGPLGQWPRARLEQTPNAGELVEVNGRWYVAVAGHPREGYKGDFGGTYARWVLVPEGVCQGW